MLGGERRRSSVWTRSSVIAPGTPAAATVRAGSSSSSSAAARPRAPPARDSSAPSKKADADHRSRALLELVEAVGAGGCDPRPARAPRARGPVVGNVARPRRVGRRRRARLRSRSIALLRAGTASQVIALALAGSNSAALRQTVRRPLEARPARRPRRASNAQANAVQLGRSAVVERLQRGAIAVAATRHQPLRARALLACGAAMLTGLVHRLLHGRKRARCAKRRPAEASRARFETPPDMRFRRPAPGQQGIAGRVHGQGISTVSTTWMTPFDCMTLGMVIRALPPLASITHQLPPLFMNAAFSPSTVFRVAVP